MEMDTTDSSINDNVVSDVESENESNSSVTELQIAFQEGLLKTDKLNYVVEKKRPFINKKAELMDKVKKFKKNLTWLETLDVAINNDSVDGKLLNDDFEREIIFYKQAEKAAQIAIFRLREMGVKIFRPADYYAEMIRQRMAEIEESKQKLEAIRRIREEKKFAAKVQKNVMERKQSEKKILAEAVKKHRKGVKSHLDAILNNAQRIQDTEIEMKEPRKGMMRGKSRKLRRVARDKKFGFGGQKKRSKQNDKKSFEEMATPGNLAHKFKKRHFGSNKLRNSAKRRRKQ